MSESNEACGVVANSGVTWKDYIEGHPERLPRGGAWETWADIPRAERQRVTKNWKAWKRRRLEYRPVAFVLRQGRIEVAKRVRYSEAETQAQRLAVMGAIEGGKTFEQAAMVVGVPVGRARWLYREGVRLQHSTEQTSVSTYPLPGA